MKIVRGLFIVIEIICLTLGIYLYLRYFFWGQIDDWFHVNNYVCLGVSLVALIINVVLGFEKDEWPAFWFILSVIIDIAIGIIFLSYILRIIWIFICYLWQKLVLDHAFEIWIFSGIIFSILILGGGTTTYYIVKVKE